jgi:hypothetical protein
MGSDGSTASKGKTPMPDMTAKDVDAAATALANWFDSQEIYPEDAVRVLTVLLVLSIHQIALERNISPNQGGRVITDIILASLP